MQVAKTGTRATRTPRQFDTLCNTELVIWAACCHIQYDFLYEMGISESLLHHLHQHLSLHLYLYLCLYLFLSLRLFPNPHIRSGLHLTLLDIHFFGRRENYFVQSLRSALSRMWKCACMVKWYRAIHLFGLTANWPCQNAEFGARRRLKGNAMNTPRQ